MNSDKGFVQNNDRDSRSNRESLPQGTTRIPVIEEELRVGKKVVESDKVSVSKKVYTDDVIVDFPITREELSVERVPKNEYLDTPPPAVRYEGDTTIVPVLKEVLVKRLVLVEEVHITRKKIKEHGRAEAALRTEEVKIERRDQQHE